MKKELTKKESKLIDKSLQEYLDLHQKENIKKSYFTFLMKRNGINEDRFEYIYSLLNSLNILTYKNDRGVETLGIKFSRNEVKDLLKNGGLSEKIVKINSTNWYNQPWLGYLIASITLVLAFYQSCVNYNLDEDVSLLENNFLNVNRKYDSLGNIFYFHNKKLDSLNAQHDSLESKLFDLKTEIELKK
jgi:hypothetical protein